MRFRVKANHYSYTDITNPRAIRYDYAQYFFFTQEENILKLEGTSWQTPCKMNEVADKIKGYFSKLNFVITEIENLI